MKCKTKLPARWGNVTMVFDYPPLKRIFNKSVAFFGSVRITVCRYYDKREEYLSRLKEFVVNKKELILKAGLPILIIIFGIYTCSSSQKDITRNISDIFTIAEDMRSYYADKPDYWGLSTESVLKNRIVQERFIKGNKLVLSGGLNILVGQGLTAETVMPRSQTFDIVAPALTKAQCISYAEYPLTKEQLVNIEQIIIGNDSREISFTWGGEYSLPVQTYKTKDICAEGKNTVIWTLK